MKDNTKKTRGKYSYAGLWIILVAAVVLEATSCIQYFYSRAGIRAEAEQRALSELQRAELEINVVTIEIETAAKMLVMLAERNIDNPDSIANATRILLNTVDKISSAGIACVPGYFPAKGHWYEICSSRDTCNGAPCIYTRQIGGPDHDYFRAEWYNNGMTIDSCWWSEPYYDNAGAKAMTVSCTHPIRNSNGDIVAVACVDLPLDYLQSVSEHLQIYKDSYYSIRSGEGQDIVPEADTVPGRKYQIYDEDIDKTGWKISIIIPEDVIFAGLNRIGRIVSLLMLLGLALLVFILWHAARDMMRLVSSTARNERMEGELHIARAIQMAMLPQSWMEDGTRAAGIDLYAVVIPAREVGGDLYDFYRREDTLFFCIGDVSGKGVPAAIVMATTRSLFRSVSMHENDVAAIVSQMNGTMSDMNSENMFVTFFIGALNLKTGLLQYCNAGHNAPVLIKSGNDTISPLPSIPNLPLGILSGYAYTPQTATLCSGDTLLLYTDGLTEAENAAHAQYGEERMMQELRNITAAAQPEARTVVEQLQQSVSRFVNGAEQSDDLTMMVIRHTAPDGSLAQKQGEPVRHTIVMRNDIQQIPTLAEWVESLQLPRSLDMTINLALEEAVTNVMLYAYPHDKSGQVLIEAEKTDTAVTFVISDSGTAFDPTAQPPADITLSAEERAIGGLGIHLVRQIMDSIAYRREDGRNILTLVKKF